MTSEQSSYPRPPKVPPAPKGYKHINEGEWRWIYPGEICWDGNKEHKPFTSGSGTIPHWVLEKIGEGGKGKMIEIGPTLQETIMHLAVLVVAVYVLLAIMGMIFIGKE